MPVPTNYTFAEQVQFLEKTSKQASKLETITNGDKEIIYAICIVGIMLLVSLGRIEDAAGSGKQ